MVFFLKIEVFITVWSRAYLLTTETDTSSLWNKKFYRYFLKSNLYHHVLFILLDQCISSRSRAGVERLFHRHCRLETRLLVYSASVGVHMTPKRSAAAKAGYFVRGCAWWWWWWCYPSTRYSSDMHEREKLAIPQQHEHGVKIFTFELYKEVHVCVRVHVPIHVSQLWD